MREQAGGPRFGLKPGQKFRAFESRTFFAEADGFYGYGPADDRINSLVHNTHSAAAEFADDLVSSGFCYRFHLSAYRSFADTRPPACGRQTPRRPTLHSTERNF